MDLATFTRALQHDFGSQEILSLKRRLNDIYVKHTGRDLATIEEALERDNFMTADAAQEFGLIDKVIEARVGEKTAESD